MFNLLNADILGMLETLFSQTKVPAYHGNLIIYWHSLKKICCWRSGSSILFTVLYYMLLHHFCFIPRDGPARRKNLEWPVLDDPAFYLCKCGCKKFPAGKPWTNVYFYTIAGARDFMLSKLVFNVVLMIIMSLISLVLFQILLGNPLQHPLRFAGIVCLGGCSLSMVFTFLAAIAARAQQNAALMAIMGFPLIIPQLMLLMKISTTSFADVLQGGEISLMLLLGGLDVLVLALAIIFFPFSGKTNDCINLYWHYIRSFNSDGIEI